MFENFEIKIVRLKSGEDIICFCYEDYKRQKTYIKHPKSFYQSYDQDLQVDDLALVDWLPSQAYAIQEAAIDMENILFTSFSTVAFGCRYLSILIEELDQETEFSQNIKNTLEAYQTPKDTTIH